MNKYQRILDELYKAANKPELENDYKIIRSLLEEKIRTDKTQYIIYDAEDNFLTLGDSVECSKYLGITKEHLYRVIGRTRRGIFKCKRYKVFKLEEDEDGQRKA